MQGFLRLFKQTAVPALAVYIQCLLPGDILLFSPACIFIQSTLYGPWSHGGSFNVMPGVCYPLICDATGSFLSQMFSIWYATYHHSDKCFKGSHIHLPNQTYWASENALNQRSEDLLSPKGNCEFYMTQFSAFIEKQYFISTPESSESKFHFHSRGLPNVSRLCLAFFMTSYAAQCRALSVDAGTIHLAFLSISVLLKQILCLISSCVKWRLYQNSDYLL